MKDVVVDIQTEKTSSQINNENAVVGIIFSPFTFV